MFQQLVFPPRLNFSFSMKASTVILLINPSLGNDDRILQSRIFVSKSNLGCYKYMSLTRCNDLMVIALDSRSGSLGSSLGQEHCAVFLMCHTGGRGRGGRSLARFRKGKNRGLWITDIKILFSRIMKRSRHSFL